MLLKMGVSVDLKWTSLSVIGATKWDYTGVRTVPDVSEKPGTGLVAV